MKSCFLDAQLIKRFVMIHARLRKKIGLISETQIVEGGRFIKEDLLTSLVFGTLKYLNRKEVSQILRHIFGIPYESNHQYDKVDIKLWHRINSIEPDVILDFSLSSDANSSQRILVEVKWESGSTDKAEEHQLTRQWKVLSSEEKKNAFHIYLVKDKIQAEKGSLFNKITHLNRVIIVTWKDIADRMLHPPSGLSEETVEFCKDIGNFLEGEKLQIFQGFKTLAQYNIDNLSIENNYCFKLWGSKVLHHSIQPFSPNFIFQRNVNDAK